MAIQFHYHQTRFKLSNPKRTTAWINGAVKSEKAAIASLIYVFCTDRYLLNINQEYLNHDTLTDIVTFDYSESRKALEGEIYISVQRVRENAKNLGVDFQTELHRVIIHGVLHLLGYKDKTKEDAKKMRGLEEKYLKTISLPGRKKA